MQKCSIKVKTLTIDFLKVNNHLALKMDLNQFSSKNPTGINSNQNLSHNNNVINQSNPYQQHFLGKTSHDRHFSSTCNNFN